jgi:hypothetical protein
MAAAAHWIDFEELYSADSSQIELGHSKWVLDWEEEFRLLPKSTVPVPKNDRPPDSLEVALDQLDKHPKIKNNSNLNYFLNKYFTILCLTAGKFALWRPCLR